MSASPVLVAIAGITGLGAAWAVYKAWQAKNETQSQQFCVAACNGNTTCIAACGVLTGIAGDIAAAAGHLDPFTNSQAAFNSGLSSDIAKNNSLNGAIAIPMPADLGCNDPTCPMMGPALQYTNGCEPFFDAPGFSKCAKGTVDMYSAGVIARNGQGGDYSADEAGEAGVVTEPYAAAPGSKGYVRDNTLSVNAVNKNNFLTGLPGDPTSVGPFGAPGSGLEMFRVTTGDGTGNPETDDNGNVDPVVTANRLQQYDGSVCDSAGNCPDEVSQGPLTYYVRGSRLTCPAGQIPKTVLLGVNGIANPDPIGTEVCVSQQGGADLCVNGQPPAGLTWDSTNNVWVPLAPDGVVNPGPCAPGYGQNLTNAQQISTQGNGVSVTTLNTSSSAGQSNLNNATAQSATIGTNLVLGTAGSNTVKTKLGALA